MQRPDLISEDFRGIEQAATGMIYTLILWILRIWGINPNVLIMSGLTYISLQQRDNRMEAGLLCIACDCHATLNDIFFAITSKKVKPGFWPGFT